MVEEPANNTRERRAAWIVLAYLGPMAVIPFVLEKRDDEVQWHATNGLVLLAAEMAGVIASIAILAAASQVALMLGCAFSLVFVAGAFVTLAVHAWAIVKGLGGTRLFVPGISDVADRLRAWRTARR
jgi:hypothetical protein